MANYAVVVVVVGAGVCARGGRGVEFWSAFVQAVAISHTCMQCLYNVFLLAPAWACHHVSLGPGC